MIFRVKLLKSTRQTIYFWKGNSCAHLWQPAHTHGLCTQAHPVTSGCLLCFSIFHTALSWCSPAAPTADHRSPIRTFCARFWWACIIIIIIGTCVSVLCSPFSVLRSLCVWHSFYVSIFFQHFSFRGNGSIIWAKCTSLAFNIGIHLETGADQVPEHDAKIKGKRRPTRTYSTSFIVSPIRVPVQLQLHIHIIYYYLWTRTNEPPTHAEKGGKCKKAEAPNHA